MKKYNEFKYELGNDEDGKRAWVKPVLVREGVAMEERFANDLNDQFVNSGVKYEEVEEEEGIKHVITSDDITNNPDLLGVVKPGDKVFIPKDAIVDPPEAPAIEAPVIPAEPVVEAAPEPVIEETPEAPAENEEGRV